jgi:hypothetical protein
VVDTGEHTVALSLPPKPGPERTTALDAGEVREAAEAAAPPTEAPEAPAPWSRPLRPPARRTSRAPFVLLTLALLLAAAVVGLVLANDPGRGPLGALDPRDDAEASASTSPDDPEPAALPEGWTRFTEPTEGWTIAVPPGYVQTLRGEQVQFRDPETRRTLRVDFSTDPGPSALGAWQAFSPQLAGRLPRYEELRLEKVEFQGLDAADLEFTFFDQTTLHVLDRTVVAADRSRGVALYWQVPESRWEGSREVFEQIARTFDFGA